MEYESILRKEINDFLQYYKMMNRDIRGFITIFNKLDAVLISVNQSEKSITRETAEIFLASFSVRNYCLYNYISHYNIFARYLNSINIYAYELELPKNSSDYTPYIFDRNELERIIKAADNFYTSTCPLYSIQIPVFIRILYGCGTRVTETLNIKVRDIDFIKGTIHLYKAKNNKQRLIPIDQTLTEILKNYISVRKLVTYDYLFHMQTENKPWNIDSVGNCFEQVLKRAGITYIREKRNDRGPSLHCLRHTFVLNSLKKSAKSGRPFNEYTPFLSTYLGHSSLRETDKYLRFSYELYDEAIASIDTYTSNFYPEVTNY